MRYDHLRPSLRRLFTLLMVTFAVGCSPGSQAPETAAPGADRETASAEPSADAVFLNGNVYTVDDENPSAQAFAVREGRFLAVGSNEEMRTKVGDETRVIDLEGAFVLPGFIDTHFHSVAAAIITAEFDTGAIPDNEGMFAALREFAATQKGRTEPLITYGWHLANFGPEGPRKEDLDEIFPDYPVLFIRSDGHGAWANTLALEAANITADTPDPSDQSYYGRDENGDPTGFIEEIPAYFGVYYPMIGEITAEWIEEKVTKAFPQFSSKGLTTVFDPGVLFAPSIEAMNAIHAYNTKHGANLRVSMSHYAVDDPNDLEIAQELIANSKSDDVFSDSIKINIDGSIETGTGAIKERYLESTGFSPFGRTIRPPEELIDLIDHSYAAGVNMHFHVCGDRGVDLVLTAMERAIQAHGPDKARGNLTHVMMIDPADMARFDPAQSGASFSALWMEPGPSMDVNINVLGQARADAFYPAGRTAAAGAKVGIGSDYPVATTFPSYAPLDNIEMFVRRARAGDPDAPMQGHDEDKLGLGDAIKAATISNAWLMGKEDELGSITSGKSADFVVLEESLFDVADHEISRVQILGTYYKGNETFASSQQSMAMADSPVR